MTRTRVVVTVLLMAVPLAPLPFVRTRGPISPVVPVFAQVADRSTTDPMARRVSDRIRALQTEADRLASQSRTLLGDLRRLELERDIAAEKVKAADAAVTASQMDLRQATERLTALEQQRQSQLPDLRLRLADIYKRGRGGYARMLVDVHDAREFARAVRAVAALSTINAQKIADHRRTLDALRRERDAMDQRTRELQAAAQEAANARVAAQRAVAARERLIADIDQRRDLNAQLAGELDVAYKRLQEQLASQSSDRPVEPVTFPLAPFRGALEWPVSGRVSRDRNGIQISAPQGTAVNAVHPGTIDYAGAFTGFGNLVIVDHGGGYFSLYGYLGEVGVARGDHVNAGAQLGRVGTAPAGPAALYFELRVDGRSVDPVQWLKPK